MNIDEFSKIIIKQKEFFESQATKDINFRIRNLKKLRQAVIDNEELIKEAIYKDFKKPHFEGYATEIGIFLEDIKYHIKKLKKWVKPKKVKTPMVYVPGASYIYPEPYGVVLIMAPWNYPFLLLMVPLVGAISAGNCVVLKPAHYSENTSDALEKIITGIFPPEYVSIFKGGREVNKELLNEKYDYIFFTGSPYLGKQVMQSASKNLTPVTLELGGKSPCIVDKDADIELAARRICWGKYVNAGQTCICPDYLFLHKEIKSEFLVTFKNTIKQFYGEDPQKSCDFSRIINDKHFERLSNLLKTGNIYCGGRTDKKDRYIEPTVFQDVTPEDPIMQEEIFGPILPSMDFSDINEVIAHIKNNPKPLALYYFSNNKKNQQNIINRVSFGGGCINDTLLHASTSHLPFGGIENSGMGAYHGKFTFDTFTHYKAILNKSLYFDVDVRYPPYNDNKLKIIKSILK